MPCAVYGRSQDKYYLDRRRAYVLVSIRKRIFIKYEVVRRNDGDNGRIGGGIQ